MRRTMIGLMAVGCVGATAGLAGAGPVESAHIPESARWVAHVDLERMAGTELGSFFLDVIDEETDRYAEIREGLSGFTLRPEGGLRGITVMGKSLEDEGEDFVALLYGTDRIAGWGDEIDRKMREHGYEAPKMEVRGVRVWVIPADEDEPMFAARTEAGGQHVWVVAKDASRAGKGAAFIRDGGHDRRGFDWRPGTIAFAAAKDPGEVADFEEISHIIGHAKSVVVRVGENDGRVFAEGRVRTDDGAKAREIARVLDGLMALGAMMSGEDEELAHVMELARGVSVDASADDSGGGALTLGFEHDAGEVVGWIRESAEFHGDWNYDEHDHGDWDESEDWDDHDDDFWGDDD